MRKLVLLITAALLSAACVTTRVWEEPDRPDEEVALLVIPHVGRVMVVAIDWAPVASAARQLVAPGKTGTFRLTPGTHTIGFSLSGSGTVTFVEVDVKAGKTYGVTYEQLFGNAYAFEVSERVPSHD